jgi:hypothetical protein
LGFKEAGVTLLLLSFWAIETGFEICSARIEHWDIGAAGGIEPIPISMLNSLCLHPVNPAFRPKQRVK